VRARHILPGARELTPFKQGNLSMLCGLYSILNSIQLALYPHRLTRPQIQRIYLDAVHHLSRRRQLKRVIGEGLIYETWAELQIELLDFVNKAHGKSLIRKAILTGSAAQNRQRTVQQIKKQLWSGSPVLAGFGGILDHYSVIAGYTERRLILFDSSGLEWIQADNLGLGEGSRRPHWILPDQTVAIEDDW